MPLGLAQRCLKPDLQCDGFASAQSGEERGGGAGGIKTAGDPAPSLYTSAIIPSRHQTVPEALSINSNKNNYRKKTEKKKIN